MVAAPVLAQAGLGQADPARVDAGTAASLRALAMKDMRVASVAYRLQTAAAFYCQKHQKLSGLIVQDATQYREDLRPAVAAVFGMTDLPAITGIVPGGPGAKAGLRIGDSIVSVNGRALIDPPGKTRSRADGARFATLVDRLDAAFAAGPVQFTIRRGGVPMSARVTGADACVSDVQLDLSGSRNAGADGQMVSISQGLLDFLRNDDELAFVMGHEISHNILGHRAFLDSTKTSRSGFFAGVGKNGTRMRMTERQADYLGLYLAAWAGYDVHAAAPFWKRMGKADLLGTLFPDGSHPDDQERVAALDQEARIIDGQRAAHQPLQPDPAQLQQIR